MALLFVDIFSVVCCCFFVFVSIVLCFVLL